MYGPKWSFLLRYGSRDTRRIDFSRVDGLSTDPRVLGRLTIGPVILFLRIIGLYVLKTVYLL